MMNPYVDENQRLNDAGRLVIEEYVAKYPAVATILLVRPKGRAILMGAKKRFGNDIVEAEAMAALVRAVIKFDTSKASLGTYVYWSVLGAVSKLLRPKRCVHGIPWNFDIMPKPEPEPELNFPTTAETILRQLTKKERRLFELRFGFETGKPMTFKEIGEVVGLSKQRVQQIIYEVQAKLRRKVHEYDHTW